MIETENDVAVSLPDKDSDQESEEREESETSVQSQELLQVERQISDMLPQLAEKVARMEIINPEVLRVTSAVCTLEQCAFALRGTGRTDLIVKSQRAEKVTTFWSHSWHGGRWKKITTVMLIYNGPAAIRFGSIFALLAMLLFHFEVLPGFDRGWPLKTILFSRWTLWAGVLVTTFVMMFWRPQTRVFLDRICIHQDDKILKAQAILSLGGILKKSDSMLILWDPSWTERLWCLFELAAFLKSKEVDRKKLIIRPTFIGPISITIFMTVTVAVIPTQMTFMNGKPSNIFLPLVLCLIFGLIVAYSAVSALRSYFRDLDIMKQQLLSISLDATRSACCDSQHLDESGDRMICDRMVVKKCVDIWFGSQEAFENTVRSEVLDVLVQDLNERVFTTPWSLAVLLPGLWAFMDMSISFSRISAVWYQHPTFLGLTASLSIWFMAATFIKDLVVPVCRLTRRKAKGNFAFEIGKNLAALVVLTGFNLFIMTWFVIRGWIENAVARTSAFIASMLLCAFCAWIVGQGIKALLKRGW